MFGNLPGILDNQSSSISKSIDKRKKKVTKKKKTCNWSASDRERICFLAGRALPKSINMARGGFPFIWVIRTLPGLTSLCAYGGSRLCICLSPAQSWKFNLLVKMIIMYLRNFIISSYLKLLWIKTKKRKRNSYVSLLQNLDTRSKLQTSIFLTTFLPRA